MTAPDHRVASCRGNADRRPVLVTGASGFAGGRVALRMHELGLPVRAMVRPGAAVSVLHAAGIEVIEGDLRSRDDVLHATAGVGRIYHFGAVLPVASVPDSYYREVNVGGTAHILEAAKRHGVERTVHCSTIAVNGAIQEIPCDEDESPRSRTLYQETKLESELNVQEAIDDGLPAVIIRPAGIYGPGDLRLLKLFRSVYLRRFHTISSSRALWRGIFIADLINGVLICGEHPGALGQQYILANDRHLTINELVKAIADAVGAPRPRPRPPDWPLAAGAALFQALCLPFGIKRRLNHRAAVFFMPRGGIADANAKDDLGYCPEVPLEEGLRRTAIWYSEQGYLRSDVG